MHNNIYKIHKGPFHYKLGPSFFDFYIMLSHKHKHINLQSHKTCFYLLF